MKPLAKRIPQNPKSVWLRLVDFSKNAKSNANIAFDLGSDLIGNLTSNRVLR